MIIVYFILILLFCGFIGYRMASKKTGFKVFVSIALVAIGITAIAMYPLLFLGILAFLGGMFLYRKA